MKRKLVSLTEKKLIRGVVGTSVLLFTVAGWHSNASGTQIAVTWSESSTDETGFSVERSAGEHGTFAEIAETEAFVTTYVDTTVADAATYCYRVRAFNAAGYSGYSNSACATTPQTFV